MRKSFPVEDLARDDRFVRVPMTERFNDPRTARMEQAGSKKRTGPGRLEVRAGTGLHRGEHNKPCNSRNRLRSRILPNFVT